MENRVVALAVLENLIHWPLANRSGYVVPNNTASAEDGGEEDNNNAATVSAGDADDLLREPRQRKLDRYRAVLLLPHLCQKLGSRWVESEVVPYLLRCVEEDDAQLSLVSGLALLGVALPRRTPLGPSTAASPTSDTAAKSAPPATGGSSSNSNNTAATAASPTSTANAYLSLEDVQPVCALLAASSAEETRAFTAQVVLPHLYFGTGLERDMSLESWDVKFVPLSVLHADMIASGGGGGGGSGEDDGSPSAAAAAARAEEGDDDVATLRFISAVRQQLVRQRRMHAEQLKNGKGGGSLSTTDTADGDTRPSTGAVSSSNTSFSKLSAAVGVRSAWVAPTEDEVRRRCLALAAEDEQMQFLFSGSYDTLTGPWGFSGNRLVSLSQGSNVLFSSAESRSSNSNGSFTSRLGNGHKSSSSSSCGPISAGGGFRCFRPHERRTNGSQVLRGDAPPASQRPLSEADLELYGASYAADSSSSSSGLVASCDDFFAVNVRARALVSDLVRWMEALAISGEADVPTSPVSQTSPTTGTNVSSSSTVSPPRQFVSLYDYVSYENRREALRGRWRGQLKVLQSLLESSYPGPVAVAVEVISGLLHALHFVLAEVEAFVLQRESGSSSHDAAAAGAASQRGDSGMSGRDVDASLWGIAVPTSPLLTTAQLQSFLYRTTRRHVAYSIAAAVTARKVAVPTSLTASADAAAWRTPTEALARLLRAALPVAQKALTELLFRHHLFDKLSPAVTTPTTTDGSSGGGGAGVVLQMGAGPCEARAAALAAWDISFTPSTAQNSVSLMPDDASFLLTASPAVDTDAAASIPDRSLWLPGTLNAFSIFRVHRVIRRALLRAVPLCVDVSSLLRPSVGSGAIPPAVFTLGSVCPMLLQVLVPPGTLRTLLNVLHAAAKLPEDAVAGRHHVDPVTGTPVTLEVAVPDLWAAMTAPGSVMGVGQTAAAVEGQETPSSLDFGLLEAALDAVQRLVVEAARQLSSAAAAAAAVTTPAKKPSTVKPPAMQAQQMAHAVCAQLFTLVAACVRWVPRYTNWKARWLIAQRLPRLTATFCFLLATVADIAGAAAVMWLQCTLQLLTSVWSCAEAFGVAPLNDLTDDEEVEVRCVAVRCGALLFRRVVETVLRVSAAVAPTSPSSGAARVQATAASVVLLLPSLAEPLAQLLDATAQCVLVGANDVDPRVRCRSAEALAVLSRTLSVLVAADGRGKSGAAATNSMHGAGSEDAVWARYLRSNTDALLRLMSDEKPTVQLALVSQLTDLLLMGKRPLSPQQLPQGKSISIMGSREDVDSRLGEEDGEDEDAEHPRSADQVQHEALLQCLRKLAQHELWRLREQYAVMLAHLCGRLLQSAMFPPFKVAGSAAMTSAVAGRRGQMAAAVPGEDLNASMQADVSPYGHTHPLYQLARTELLTLLVAVLFDKVKAVRDAALDAVERMCLQLAAAAQQNNNSLQRDFGSSLGLPSRGSNGASGAAVSGGRGGQAFNAVTSASSSALRNGSGSYNCNTFVDDVLWPRISAYDKAWETYLSRSALLHIALRLRVEKASVFIPLLDQLARDHVLNVRLVVAKIILEVLLRSAPDVSSAPWPLNKDGEDEGGAEIGGDNAHSASYKPDLPSGTVAYRILMNRPADPVLRGGGGGGGVGGAGGVLPPLQFTEEERTGVILQILRQLLKDASSDVRDEAAKALKVCF